MSSTEQKSDQVATRSSEFQVPVCRVDTGDRKSETTMALISKTDFIDSIAIEEPLEIRLSFEMDGHRQQKTVSITMRTPGHDDELASGFLFTEGIVENPSDITKVAHCGPPVRYLGHSNVIKVEIQALDQRHLKSLERNFYTTSSCGVCGKSSIEALKTQNRFTKSHRDATGGVRVRAQTISALPDRLRQSQRVFDRTGGLHASGLFTAQGDLLTVREDVGRHNALDKIIGHALLNGQLPLDQNILMLSGRISFELVQKAAMAGLTFIAAVGAPSSLAIELAKEMHITLIGFVRGSTFNVYCGGQRLEGDYNEASN